MYASPDIIRVIKSGIRLRGDGAPMTNMTHAHKILVRKPEGGRPLTRPWGRFLYKRSILRYILRKHFYLAKIRSSAGSFEHGNERSDSIKGEEFLG